MWCVTSAWLVHLRYLYRRKGHHDSVPNIELAVAEGCDRIGHGLTVCVRREQPAAHGGVALDRTVIGGDVAWEALTVPRRRSRATLCEGTSTAQSHRLHRAS